MTETREKRTRIKAENVIIGVFSSRLSSIIFLLLCLVPVITTLLFGAVDNATWVVITVVWLAIVLLWLAESWKGGGFLFNPSLLQTPLIGLTVIGIVQLVPIGTLVSLDPYSTRFFVLRLVIYLVFFAACLAFINNGGRLKKAAILVVIFGSLMAFFGILQRLANPDGIYGMRGTPQAIPFGSFVNQHHFAAFMQMTGGVTLGLLFGKKTGRDKKILLAISIVIMGVAAVLTSSRGGLLGFAAVFAFVALLTVISGRWSRSKKQRNDVASTMPRKVAIAAAGAALVIVVFGVVLLIGGNDALLRGIGVANDNADISSGRAHFWPIALQIFLEHPLMGAGFDSFGVAFTRFDTWNGLLRVEQAHNDYLQTLADSGVAGFICIAVFIYLLFRQGLATAAGSGSGFRHDVAVGALAGCFGILIHSFFDFPLRTPSNAFFFLLLCAIATVPIKQDETVRTGRRRTVTEP
jgi:O-antigen ligase